MRKASSVALIPTTRARILAPLYLNPDKAWYFTELAKHLHVRHTSIQRELTALAKAGHLVTWRDGGRRYYRANTAAPTFPELSGLLIKTVGLVDVLRQGLVPFEARIDAAFVFGSVAAGNETARSDVDLFIIGDVGLKELTPILNRLESTLVRPVNPVIQTQNEFQRRIRRKDHFVSSVLAKPRLLVLGKLDDIVGATGKARYRRTGTTKQTGDRGPAQNGRA